MEIMKDSRSLRLSARRHELPLRHCSQWFPTQSTHAYTFLRPEPAEPRLPAPQVRPPTQPLLDERVRRIELHRLPDSVLDLEDGEGTGGRPRLVELERPGCAVVVDVLALE